MPAAGKYACPPSLATPESMFVLSLNRTDRLRLLAAPPEVIHLVARAVHQVPTIGCYM
jgi:hypothetical protein